MGRSLPALAKDPVSNPTPERGEPPAVSVVVPVYNEEQNVRPCCQAVREALEPAGLPYELIMVDDGSTDGSLRELQRAAGEDPRVCVVELRRNFGQAAAMAAGFDRARAELVVAMDGDLQNDPADIPALLNKLQEPPGYDVVSGWRQDRQDSFSRVLPSRMANWLISRLTGVHLHDYGCSLKAYRRDVLSDVKLYGEMHRFIPALVHWVGGRVTEMPVNHRPRRAGESKYGLSRTFRVLLDLATVKFMLKYMTKPLYFFGKLAALSLLAALVVLGVVVLQKLSPGTDMTGNPLLYLSVALGIIGVQIGLMGLMMEVLTRVYYESQDRPPYSVRGVHGGSEPGGEF
jgi:glycosyltransferase involved in cell wall biosynthesis